MNDHASALGVWLTALHHHDPPATVVHIDRHSDLAAPTQCQFPHVQRWESCVDRAGFQLAAAWLGLVDRIWWLRPGGGETSEAVWTIAASRQKWPEVVGGDEDEDGYLGDDGDAGKDMEADLAPTSPPLLHVDVEASGRWEKKLAVRAGPLCDMDELHTWRSPTADERDFDLPAKSPHILDIDLDFWGGAAGPLPPPWEIPPLQSCGDFLRLHGAAAWADPELGRHMGLWAPLLRPIPISAAAERELALRRTCFTEGRVCAPSNRTLMDVCKDELTQYARSCTLDERERLRRAHIAGLSVPEALLSIARTHQGEGEQCGTVDEAKLAAMLRPLNPQVVTIARSVDAYMPWRCGELLEAAVLRVLRLAYNRTLHVSYLSGTVDLQALAPLRSR
jgi:hypothetical protein